MQIEQGQQAPLLVNQIQEAIQKAIRETVFDGNPTDDWFEVAANALLCTSPAMLGISAEKYDELYEIAPPVIDLTLYEAGLLINVIETKSPKDLGVPSATLSFSGYIAAQRETEHLAAQWNEQLAKLKTAIEERFAEEHKTKKMLEESVGGFKPAIGEV